jgi:hypothetical protein
VIETAGIIVLARIISSAMYGYGVRNILKHACAKKHKESNGDCDGLWESHTGPGCGLGKVLWSDLNDKRIFEGKVFFCKQLC